ncbi:oligosaccharide repeat unit polymerase, partial [Candidatus Saccharibacteria bacterium]|nr:oligosaccharide repeat unit polymerase [Candidatus Saccharibacteria bacterium]
PISGGSGGTTEDPVINPLVEGSGDGNGANEEDQENCKIDYIGWFICPIVNTLASMSEGARAQLINMLTVDAKSILGDTSDGSVYSYWSMIRDYANILFVVFFLFVIYSQITGYGLDNYGIKRMLPKLIIGVIVVNASFYICGLLVDLSNVVGSSAFNFVSTAAVGDIPAGDWSNSDSGWINKIAGLALVLTVGYFALAAVISMLLFVVITAVTTIFLLGVREAIIIMCIVLSPLAFVAMIMPNTEGLYKKWWSAFKAALMVYPMVGLVYGASNLAARILGSGLKESDIIMQSIVALLVFAPLLIVPKLVRSAVEIIGIGGAVAWLNKKMNKGRDRLTDKVGKWRENKLTSQFGKHRREKAQLRNAQIRGGTYRGKGGIANFRNWRSAANRRLNAKSGDFGQKRKLGGSAAALAEDNERMKAASAWIADNNMSSDELSQIAITGKDRAGNSISSYQRRAAMQALAPHMTSEQAANLATASASFGDASLQKEAANAIAQSGAKKAPWLGGKQLEAIRQGTYNEQEAMSDYIQNKASGQGLANADANAVNKMVTFAENEARHNADNSYMRSLMRARADIEADPKTAGGISSAVRQEIERIPPMPRQSNSGGGGNQGGGGGQGDGN